MSIPNTQTDNFSHQYCIIGDTIYFYNEFNEPLDKYYDVINTIKHLKFSNPPNDQDKHSKYNPSLFNQPIEIPTNLTSIEFGRNFNHPINLTPELTCVHLGYEFNQQIVCTKKLIHLKFSDSPKHSIVLPKYLENLHIKSMFCKLPIVLNKNIKFFNGSGVLMPLTKKLLCFEGFLRFNQQPNLSKNLMHLLLACNSCIEYLVLPKNIKTINIIGRINPFILTPRIISIKSYMPFPNVIIEQTIKTIDINNLSLMECLPNTITHIVLRSLDQIANLPSSIRHIKVREEKHISKIKPLPNVIVEYNEIFYPGPKMQKEINEG